MRTCLVNTCSTGGFVRRTQHQLLAVNLHPKTKGTFVHWARPPFWWCRPDNGTGSPREPGRSTASCIRTRAVALHGTRTAGGSEEPPGVENSLWHKSPRGAARRNDASPLPDREVRFPFGLRRPPTLACSGFAARLRLRVRARRSGRVRRRSACVATGFGLCASAMAARG